MGRIAALGALAVLAAGCAAPPVPAPTTTAATGTTTTPAPPSTTTPVSPGAAIREWEAVAGDHFTESARALEDIAEGSDTDDAATVRSACRRLHDTNSEGLQGHLPTPDPELTAELQRMIDDMNVATHACLRFAASRDQVEATTYRTYLARAVDHLQRAKVILTDVRGR